MSRSQSRRDISAGMREAIEAEMSCSLLSNLRDGCVLPELETFLADAATMSEVRSRVGQLTETAPRLALDILAADFRQLRNQAEQAGVADASLAPIDAQISDLFGSADSLGADDLRTMTQATIEVLAAFEDEIVDAVAGKRATDLAVLAMTEVLGRMGFDVTIERATGEATIRGTNVSGQLADITIDADVAEVSFDDPATAVHPLDPRASEICLSAVDLAADFHTRFVEMGSHIGLFPDRVEAVEQPTRGARRLGRRRAKQTPKRRATK